MSEKAVVFSPSVWRALIEHCRSSMPEEACGLLGMAGGVVCGIYPAENIRHSRVTYEISAAEQLRLRQAIASAGQQLWGIYHSHPGGTAWPSAVDVAQAYYPELHYIIVSCGRGEPVVAVFRIVAGRVSPQVVSLAPG